MQQVQDPIFFFKFFSMDWKVLMFALREGEEEFDLNVSKDRIPQLFLLYIRTRQEFNN